MYYEKEKMVKEKRSKRYKDDIDKEQKEIYENLISENEEKDKQIDLMANYIVDLIKYNNPEEIRKIEEIKQHFEQLAKEKE